MDGDAIYESARISANLWQSYTVAQDEVVLRTWFGRFRIPYSQIKAVGRSAPLVRLVRAADFKNPIAYRSLKLDFADFREHAFIETTSGIWRGYHFTPDDPEGFLSALVSAASRAGVKLRVEFREPEDHR